MPKKVELKIFKALSISEVKEKNALYCIKGTTDTEFTIVVTDINGVIVYQKDIQGVNSVSGTGVTGTSSNPIVNISTFLSSQAGNLISLSLSDGKLFVEPITSPDNSITVSGTDIQIEASILASIASALQSGDNISELNNDAGYLVISDLPDTKAEYDSSLTDGNFLFVGDISQYTDEQSQDAIGTILVDSSTIDLSYNDVLPSITADIKANSITSNELASGINISEFTNDSGYITNTNLNYSASPTTGTVSSDTGTDAILPLVDNTNSGLMAPTEHIKLTGIETGAEVNDIDTLTSTDGTVIITPTGKTRDLAIDISSPVTNILSSVLTTQDAAGLVLYINSLASSFFVGNNQIQKFHVTDTGQVFDLLLNGRSFGGTEPDVVVGNILDYKAGVLSTEFIWSKDVYNWQASGSSITLIGSATPTTVGTASNIASVFTALYSSAPNSTWSRRSSNSAATAGSSWEFYEASKRTCSVGIGFYFSTKVAVATNQTNDRYFFGLMEALTATGNVNPTTLTNIVGFGKNSGETTMHVIYNDASGTATSDDLGASFPLNGANQAYHLELWNLFGSTTVIYRVKYINTMVEVMGVISTDLPATVGNGLTPHLWGNNGTTAATVTGQWSHLTILTPN